ncbi:MAG: DUF3880 domain-containing protein [Lachnospiraceae bacterium]|nr:DUF3880 domain-containing protein [Lachnospiraceae bacterium]
MNNIKIIFFQQKETITSLCGMLWGVLELGADLYQAKTLVTDRDHTEEELESVLSDVDTALSEELKAGQMPVLLTQDFCTPVAEAAHLRDIPYICWPYDSPQEALYRTEALYDTNMIFCFDRKMSERLKKRGIKHLCYEPLAANMHTAEFLDLSKESLAAYISDISFVGNFYSDKKRAAALEKLRMQVPQVYDAIETVLKGAEGCFKKEDRFFGRLPEAVVKWLVENSVDVKNVKDPEAAGFFVECYIGMRELANRERTGALRALSELSHIKVYTSEQDKDYLASVTGAEILNAVSYDREMPLVFAASKINLNITMPGIESGVPQRVFDIMSMGGLCLTNWQPEAEELFDTKKELAAAKDYGELKELASFYLKNEKARLETALAGYLKVKECYTYPKAMKRILEKSCEVFML